jgi:hypothetical protein
MPLSYALAMMVTQSTLKALTKDAETMSGWSVSKPQREMAILRTVYGLEEYSSVQPGDMPDFVLVAPGREEFGVEVTELHRSDSHARATYHPSYIGKLLAGGRPMHKDDKSTFAVNEVTVSDPEGNVRQTNIPAIITQTATFEDHYRAITDVVSAKSSKFGAYRTDVAHTNLIILDRYERQHIQPGEFSVTSMLTSDLRAALYAAPYREVFLVSEDFHRKQTYQPLQLLLLMESFYVFVEAANSFTEIQPFLTTENVVRVFADVLGGRGMPVDLREGKGGETCAAYKGAGIQIIDARIVALDFSDFPLPLIADVPPVEVPADIAAAFSAHHAKIVADYSFMAELRLDVRSPTEF